MYNLKNIAYVLIISTFKHHSHKSNMNYVQNQNCHIQQLALTYSLSDGNVCSGKLHFHFN